MHIWPQRWGQQTYIMKTDGQARCVQTHGAMLLCSQHVWRACAKRRSFEETARIRGERLWRPTCSEGASCGTSGHRSGPGPHST